MRIIFLDIDGPMIPDQIHLLPGDEKFPLKKVTHFGCFSKFSPYSVAFIKTLCDGYGAKVLTNSTHNMSGKDHIKKLFEVNGLNPDQYLHSDIMTEFKNGIDERDVAVCKWILENQPESFVIIDDALEQDYDAELGQLWGINASSLYGLTIQDRERAIKLLLKRKKDKSLTEEDYKLIEEIYTENI